MNDLPILFTERERKANERRYYTYVYGYPENYPDAQLAGTIFYVGKGTGSRIYRHEDETRRGVQSAKCDAIRQIWTYGCEAVKRKIHENLTHQESLDLESQLIQMYGRSTLTNVFSEDEDENEIEQIIPFNICLFKVFRQEMEEQVRSCMEQEGIEISKSACHKYLQSICMQAIREHVKRCQETS